MANWDIIGQERAIAALRRAVAEPERLSHAYLFAGPEHVGRATAARLFAQALNCEAAEPGKARLRNEGPEPEFGGVFAAEQAADFQSADEVTRPCGACRACRLIAADKHPDVEWLGVGGVCEEPDHRDHSADNSRDIRICQVRRLQRTLNLPPFEGRYRVIIVEPADALTNEAANAFLKTLEEPPPYVVMVLLTAREEALPETVRSRCRRIVFSGVPRQAIEGALRERWEAEPEQAARLARLAQGRLGWAVAALEDDRLLTDREQTIDDIEALAGSGYSERFAYAASLGSRFSRDPQTVRATLEVWREWWRDVLLAAAGQEALASGDRLDTVRSQAAQWGVAGALQALRAIGEGRRNLEEHASPTLALEVMLLELTGAAAQRR